MQLHLLWLELWYLQINFQTIGLGLNKCPSTMNHNWTKALTVTDTTTVKRPWSMLPFELTLVSFSENSTDSWYKFQKDRNLSLFSLLFRQTLSFSSYWKQRQLIPFSWVNQCSPEVNGTVFWNLFCLNEYRNQKNQKKIWKNENKRPHLFNNQLLFFLHNPVHYTVTAEKKKILTRKSTHPSTNYFSLHF